MTVQVLPTTQQQQQQQQHVQTYSIYDNHNRKVSYPLLNDKDITTGVLLGRGAFNNVREVLGICPKSQSQRILNESQQQPLEGSDQSKISSGDSSGDSSTSSSTSSSRRYIYDYDGDEESSFTSLDSCSSSSSKNNNNNNNNNKSSTSNEYSYAIKEIRNDLSLEERLCARIDLENEALLLTKLSHQNIIKMHGLGEGSSTNIFLLLERIDLTLKEKCLIWKKEHKTTKPFFFKRTQLMLMGSVNRKKKANAWNERLNVANDLANVLTYLHKMNIIFRDLKPENIGFDREGRLKLFDFGLAASLTSAVKVTSDQYQLTANTGTRRYMAPEVYRGMYYGKPADVYSFAIVLWEIMTLKTAFKGETRASHAQKVYGHGHHRPQVPNFWPLIFQQLVRESWSVDAAKRPTFNHVRLCLNHSQL